MNLVGSAGHLADRPHRGVHHDRVARAEPQPPKPVGERLS